MSIKPHLLSRSKQAAGQTGFAKRHFFGALFLVVAFLVLSLSCVNAAGDRQSAAIAADYIKFADLASKQGDTKTAIDYYLKAIEFDPQSRQLRFNLVLAYIAAMRFEEGNILNEQLLLEDPGNVVVLENRAYFLAVAKKADAAFQILSQLYVDGNRRDSILYNLILLSEELARFEDAWNYGSLLLEFSPKASEYRLRVAVSGLKAGKEKEAQPLLEEYRDSVGTDAKKLLALAEVYAKNKFYGQALQIINPLLESGNNPDALFLRATVRQDSGQDSDEVIADLLLAIKSQATMREKILAWTKSLPAAKQEKFLAELIKQDEAEAFEKKNLEAAKLATSTTTLTITNPSTTTTLLPSLN